MKILALEGGGINGLMTASILDQLGLKGTDFDLIAGTSTGAILAGGLRAGLEPREIMDLYVNHGRDIFPPYWRRALSGRIFGGLIRPRYGREALRNAILASIPDAATTPLAAYDGLLINAYNVDFSEFVCYRSWKTGYNERTLLDALLDSSAAPVYFAAHESYIDGGVVVNNPSEIAASAAVRMGVNMEGIKILSIGTGYRRAPVSDRAKKLGAITMGLEFVGLTLSGSSQVVDYISRQYYGNRYVRIDLPYVTASGAMDDASADNLSRLIADSRLTESRLDDADRARIDVLFRAPGESYPEFRAPGPSGLSRGLGTR